MSVVSCLLLLAVFPKISVSDLWKLFWPAWSMTGPPASHHGGVWGYGKLEAEWIPTSSNIPSCALEPGKLATIIFHTLFYLPGAFAPRVLNVI